MKKQIKKKVSKTVGETLVNFILDKSGSMESVKSATISGFNEYINTLKKDGNKYSFSLTLFDTQIETPFINTPLNEVDNLDAEKYDTNGSTALYDAVCTTIKKVDEKVGQKVITIIMTDGEENASKEYTQVQMKAMIAEREKKGNWSFVYLGANQDSYVNAQKFGISQMNTSNFVATDAGITRSMNLMASNTASFATSSLNATSAFFSQADQSNLGATDDQMIKQHFSSLGKKSWDKRRKDILS